jgi:hypothetical protein
MLQQSYENPIVNLTTETEKYYYKIDNTGDIFVIIDPT